MIAKFVYSNKYGFGIILDKLNNGYRIGFFDYKVITLHANQFVVLKEEFLPNLKSLLSHLKFNIRTIPSDIVITIDTLNENKMVIVVNEEKVELDFNNETLSCSCIEEECKHKYFALKYVINCLTTLDFAYKNKIDFEGDSITNIQSIFTDQMKFLSDDNLVMYYDNIKSSYDIIANNKLNDTELGYILCYIFSKISTDLKPEISAILLSCDKIRSYILTKTLTNILPNILSILGNYSKLFSSYANKYRFDTKISQCFASRNYELIFTTFMGKNEIYSFSKNICFYAFAKMQNPTYDNLYTFANWYNDLKTANTNLEIVLGKDKTKAIYDLMVITHNNFPSNSLISYLNPKAQVFYILRDESLINQDNIQKLLFELKDNCSDYVNECVNLILLSLKDGIYKEFYSDIINKIDVEFIKLIANQNIIPVDSYNKLNTQMKEYLSFSYALAKDNDDAPYTLTLNLNLVNSNIFSLSYNNNEIEIIKDVNNFLNNNKTFANFIIKTLIYENDDLRIPLEEESNNNSNLSLSAEYSKAIEEMDKCNNVFLDYISRIKRTDRAHFTLYYDLDNSCLEVKIGNSKAEYKIKKFVDFLNNMQTDNTIKFGSKLELKLTEDNFVYPSSDLFDYFLEHKRFFYINESHIPISHQTLVEILNIIKGDDIYISNQKYNVDLNEKTLHISIDNDYVLRIDNITNCTCIPLHKTYLILDNDDNKIYITKQDARLNAFYKAMFELNNRSIKPIIDAFKTKVYMQFLDYITIDEYILNDFAAPNIKINAYFDYDLMEGKIVEYHDIYVNDIQISDISKLEDTNVYQLQIFESLLNNIGFVDNQLVNDDDIISFFKMDLSPLQEYANIYLSDTIKKKIYSPFSSLKINVKYNSGLFEAAIEQSIYSNEELKQIIDALREKKKYVLLKDKFIDLDTQKDQIEEFKKSVIDLNLYDYSPVKLTVSEALRAFTHENSINIDSYLQDFVSELNQYKNSNIELPEINGELRTYQKEAVKWLDILTKYNVGGILADEMGLGKTVEIITLLKKYNNISKPILIVCPKSLLFNWKYEFSKFDPETTVKLIYGESKTRERIINNIEQDKRVVYICSYDSLRLDLDLHKDIQYSFLIVDEAQYIKNVFAQKSISVKNINADHIFALTGTPIENSLFDLWSIFDLIMPGYFEPLDVFKRLCAEEDYSSTISNRVAPFILRRTKRNVLSDLPEKFERILSSELTVEQRKIYDATRLQAKNILETSKNASPILLATIMRLREICVSPDIVYETANYSSESGKIELLLDIVSEYTNDGRKILIFSQFVKALSLVKYKLDSLNIPSYTLTGETSADDRIRLSKAFNEKDNVKVFLISLKAGGTGLNLTGADTVIHLDPWWNISAESQATDRAHRIGQKKNVEVIKLIAENTVEQKVIELQNIKKDLIDKVIRNDDSGIINSSIDDIKFILD